MHKMYIIEIMIAHLYFMLMMLKEFVGTNMALIEIETDFVLTPHEGKFLLVGVSQSTKAPNSRIYMRTTPHS